MTKPHVVGKRDRNARGIKNNLADRRMMFIRIEAQFTLIAVLQEQLHYVKDTARSLSRCRFFDTRNFIWPFELPLLLLFQLRCRNFLFRRLCSFPFCTIGHSIVRGELRPRPVAPRRWIGIRSVRLRSLSLYHLKAFVLDSG